MHLLITGERNVGKSTLIKNSLKKSNITCKGFFTLPHKKNNILDSFIIEPIIADKNDQINNWASRRIGILVDKDWKAVPEAFDLYGTQYLSDALTGDNRLIVMDELGFFENDSLEFQEKVFSCLDQHDKPVIAVVKAVDTSFLNKVRAHKNTKLLTVTTHNRDQLTSAVAQWIRR